MGTINSRLLDFFAEQYKPGIIGVIGTDDPVGLAIREGQRLVTADGRPSLWSHCFILGNLRLDRRGQSGAVTESVYIFESDLRVSPFKPQIRNGAQENWIGKWCDAKVKEAAVIDFGLSDSERNMVMATALQLVDQQVLYPIQELLGTWLAILMRKQWEENPINDPHAMYCSSFVRYCYAEAGRDILDPTEVSVSNTTPEDIARAATRKGALRAFRA